jgi:hypothetical protein
MTFSPSDDEQQIIRLAQERSVALVHKDLPRLDQLLADSFQYVNASGTLLRKADYLRLYVTSPEMQWQSQELQEVQVQLHDHCAILTARVHDLATFHGQPLDAFFRVSQVYVRHAGRWQCVLAQSTTIPPT